MRNLFSIPARSHYGLVFLSYLADAGEQPVTTSHVARELGISQGYLEEIASALRKAGMIKGIRGMGGGYRLVRAPGDITLKNVFEALEGPLALVGCLAASNGQACTVKNTFERKCRSRPLLAKAQEGIAKQLEAITLAEGI